VEVSAVDAIDESKGLVYFTATKISSGTRPLRAAFDGTGFTRVTKDEGTHAVVFAPTRPLSTTPIRHRHTAAQDSTAPMDRASPPSTKTKSPSLRIPSLSHGISQREIARRRALNASIIKPPDFNPQKKYPVLVYTYGGPHAQVVRNGWGGANFLWHQPWRKRATLSFRLIIAAPLAAAMLLKRAALPHGAQELPTSAMACNI